MSAPNPNSFKNDNTGNLTTIVEKPNRYIHPYSAGDYDTVTRLVRLSLLSAAASSAYPTVGQKFGWSF